MKSARSAASSLVSLLGDVGGSETGFARDVLRPFGFLPLALRGAGALLRMMGSARQSRRMA